MDEGSQVYILKHCFSSEIPLLLKICELKRKSAASPPPHPLYEGGKGIETRDQIGNTEKTREFQKNFCFINYAKPFDCVDHNKLGNS